MHPGRFSRRRLLALGGVLAGCGALRTGTIRTVANADYLRLPVAPQAGRVAVGLYRGDMRAVCDWIVPQVTDLRWLSRGDSVFVKVVCNSPGAHPRVTSPAAVRAFVGYLRDHGAGTIYVGDQAGAEHVRMWRTGRRSSTRSAMFRNGLLQAIEGSGATPHFFDDQGWDGYFQPPSDFVSRWGEALWIPRILDEVDHVVVLPRLGAHGTAGYTCGIKAAVGWLRDDSRLALHQRGPVFFERIAEINHVRPLRDKLRLVLTLCTHALLNIGPDLGAAHDLGGVLGLASTSLVDHDAVAAALLPWLDADDTSLYDLYAPYPRHVDYWNRGFVAETWGEDAARAYEPLAPNRLGRSIEHDAMQSHLARLQGYRPAHIRLVHQDGGLQGDLLAYLRRFGGGLFTI